MFYMLPIISCLFVLVILVAGNWGSWLPWSPCSETCGQGIQSRLRLCNNPPPAFDGPQCEGSDTQTQVCKERPCPGKKTRIVIRWDSNLHLCLFSCTFMKSDITCSFWGVFWLLLQWMESGHPGWAGEPAVFHVEVEPDRGHASVLALRLNMVAGSVKAMMCTLISATVTPAPVSHITFYLLLQLQFTVIIVTIYILLHICL